MSRENPFELAFGPWRERFERIRESLAGADSADRDRFLLNREVAALLLELRPLEGYGDATEAMAGLVHHGYLFWVDGERVREIGPEDLNAVVGPTGGPADGPKSGIGFARYLQLPPLAVWGLLDEGPPEPLDGWFAVRSGQTLSLLAVFGIRRGRAGFTTIELRGEPPALDHREDGTPLFAPLGSDLGARAGMPTVAGEAELLELGWRAEALE